MLSDTRPHMVKRDAKLLEAAIRHGWDIPPEARKLTVDRLVGVVKKTSVDIITANGPEASEYHADGMAVAAARVLVAMEGQNQADRHLDDKNARLDAGKTTENVGFAAVVKGVDMDQL